MSECNTLFLVEDNQAEARLFEMAFQDAGTGLGLQHCADGESFFSRLREQAPSEIALFVIDLNLPGVSGFELVRHLRSRPVFHQTPILIFSNSQHHRDVHQAYRAGVNAYVSKPMDLDEYNHIVRRFLQFMIRPCPQPVA